MRIPCDSAISVVEGMDFSVRKWGRQLFAEGMEIFIPLQENKKAAPGLWGSGFMLGVCRSGNQAGRVLCDGRKRARAVCRAHGSVLVITQGIGSDLSKKLRKLSLIDGTVAIRVNL
jgi:hypothetical protein